MEATAKKYIEWIEAHLDRKAGKTRSGLARHLGLAHPQITMMLQGKRRIKVDEVPKIAEYLEVDPPVEFDDDLTAEFHRLLPLATEEARQAALAVLRLGQTPEESDMPASDAPDPPPSKRK